MYVFSNVIVIPVVRRLYLGLPDMFTVIKCLAMFARVRVSLSNSDTWACMGHGMLQ